MVLSLIKRLSYKKRKFYDDDFDWDNYTSDSYRRRLEGDIEPQYSTSVQNDHLEFDASKGIISAPGRSLHPNAQLILEAIGQLKPRTVHEVGCGGGDHVANAKALFPSITVTGGDRGKTQLEMALARHPELDGQIGLQDITMPYSSKWPKVEFVYSQAVLMHIHTAASHLVAIANLTRISSKYVLLMENLQCHNFVNDVLALYAGGHLDWESLFIYRFDGSSGARAILLSKERLHYPELAADSEIRQGIEPSRRRLKRSDEDSARGIFGFES